MSTARFNWSRALIAGVFLLLLSSCDGSGDGSDSKEIDSKAVLNDPTGLLTGIGITSLEDLKTTLAQRSALTLTLELTEADPSIKVESIVRLLKHNNRNIEYHKLKNLGISDELIAKLIELSLSPVAVNNLVRLPASDIFPMPDITRQAVDLYNAEKLKVLNRQLRLADQSPLNITQFTQLQSAFAQVDIVDNFGKLDQQFQNVLVKDDPSGRASQAGRSQVLDTPAGYHLGNYEMELDEVDADLPFADSCYIIEPQLPMVVSQAGSIIDSSLVTEDSGNATVKLPQPGIAMFAVSSDTVVTVNLQRSDGFSLLNQEVVGTYYIYLPITQNDTCTPFTFVGASSSYSIKLIDIKSTQRLSKHFYYEGNEYLSPDNQIELINSNAFFNAQSYSFSSINSLLNNVDLLFKMETSSVGNTGFDVLIFSPSGKAYSATQYGINGFHSAQGFNADIIRENGVWRVDLLPPGSTQTTNDQLTGITARVTDNNASGRYLNVLSAVNTDPQVQTREFVLGMLKNVSLKTQGDNGHSNEGEISLTMNTTMAPKLNVPSYLEDMIARDGTMNDQIALWQCWIKSEQTGNEFSTNSECYEYKDEFERQQDIYESIRNNRYDPQNDPIYYQCRDENGDEDVCIRGVPAPYSIEFPTEPFKVIAVMTDYSNTMDREYRDVEYLNVLSNYYDLYLNWKERSVQIDTSKFPYDGLAYKTREVLVCDTSDADCTETDPVQTTFSYFNSPVIIETNRPVFGIPADRVNQSTLPINFDYLAIDQDEYDYDAELFAVLGYAATQVYNIATGNFVGLVCNSVGLLDDLHELEMDAEDDPLGSARASINRYSSSDPFYGLHNTKKYNFFISGVPENNTEIDTHGQTLSYAQMACGVAGLAESGYNFFQRADYLLSLDYAQFGEHADLVTAISGIAGAINSAQLAAQAEDIATMIENGQFDEARELLKLNTDINNLTQGTDVYANMDELLNTFSNEASAANGNNIIKSNAHYLLDEGRKTRAHVEFQRIHSVPTSTLQVTLDSLKIISNYETDDDASVQIKPYVGLISDRPRGGLNTHSLFSDEDDGSDAATGYLRFYGVADGDVLTPNAQLFSSADSNVAAIYVELAIIEDDGFSAEDDDMIGVFSQTFKLEEIFNTNAEFKWEYLGGNDYQLVISDYPVYNSHHQRTLENPLSDDYELQKKHNRNRSPSALVNLTIRLQVGDLSDHYPQIDSGIAVSEVNAGKDTYSMNMNEINSLDIVDMEGPELFDVLEGLAIITPSGHAGVNGAVFHYDSETFALTEMFRYDSTDFSGDLLPIKQALTSTNNISNYIADGLAENRAPSLIKLLPDNRMLFAISGDDGAKLMVVSFTDQGVMTLESSQTVIEVDSSLVYSLMDATLSPDRKGLLVPYVPQSYKSGDKTQAVNPKVLYYQLQGDDFVYRDTIENVAGTISGAEFIGNNAVSLTLKKLAFVTSSSTVWDWLDDNLRDLHAACSSNAMSCLYEVLNRDIFIYQINDTGLMELKESFDHYSAPITYGPGKTVNHYSALRNHVIDASGISHAETLSATETTAVLRYNQTVYQLGFDMNVDGFVKTGSSSLTPRKHILYNPLGLYYCAEGLSCSGYLQPANAANNNDDGTYISPNKVMDFDFADYARDLILSIDTQAIDAEGNSCDLYTYVDIIGAGGYISGISFIRNPNCFRHNQLKLTSLYDGPAAFKGPQISGDIFDTEVTMDGSNNIAALTFTFDVTDRDTRIDQLLVSVAAKNDPFDEVIKAPFKTNSPLYTAHCETNQDGQGSCSGTIIPDYENASFKQTISVSVSDGLYTSVKEFTLFLDREAPVLFDSVQNIQLATPAAYQSVDFVVDSSTSASAVNCAGTDYCYLINNGFVDEWELLAKPDWLICTQQQSADYGSQNLHCSGQPPIGQSGSSMMQIIAYQMKGSSYQKSDSMMMTINVVEPDIVPNMFSFVTQNDLEQDTEFESALITVSGLTGYTTLSLDQGEYWRSSTGVWTTVAADDIVNNETIRLRLRSSTEFSTATTANLTIGGVTASFTLNTKVDPDANDTIPDAFSFQPVTDQLLSTLIESDSITISGINEPSPVTITNGEYKIAQGAWTQQAGQISNGENIMVRHTTAATYVGITLTELTIGGVSAEFSSTSQQLQAPQFEATFITEPMINDAFEFTPTNSGGEVDNWSINNQPSWASFDEQTGQLSGTVNSLDSFNVEITATNASGSDTFTAVVMVRADSSPYINGYATDCLIDEGTCDFTFTDNPNWRASVNLVTIGEPYGGAVIATLTSPADYELREGQIRLHFTASNQMVKSAGEYSITIQSSNYNDVDFRVNIVAGVAIISNVTITPALAAGTISTFSLNASNRFGVPVTALYPELTQTDNDSNFVEQFQYRQASTLGDSNIWKTFGSWNELTADENGDLSFDVKLPGCIDINDGFDLLVGNASWIYWNASDACIDTDWATRYQLLSEDNRNIVIDSQHQMYRVYSDDYQLYLSKYDRNGIEKWTKALTSTGTNWFEGIVIYNDQLFITGSTNIDIDGAGSGQGLGSFDLFVQRFDLEGQLVWSRQFGTTDGDYTYGMTINNDLIDILARINTEPSMTGDSVIYQMDLDGNNQQITLDNSTLGTGRGEYTPIQVDSGGNYYLTKAGSTGVKKYQSNGTLAASNVEFTSASVTDMLLEGDALYLSMDATSAYADEIWNANETKAVRVVRLRTSDLSVVWSKLIQSDAPYAGLENSNGQLAFYNGVVYLSLVAKKELYYQGLVLTETPNYSLNLIALNADGEDDGNGNNSGAGFILDHKSWLTGPEHATDERENPYLGNNELTISSAGWLHLSINAKQNFVSTAQIGRVQTTPYPYYTNSVLMKTQLAVTSLPLTQVQTGMSRNNATQIVTDFDNNLQWDDSISVIQNTGNWSVANNSCDILMLDGEDNWRLPTPEELAVEGHIPLPGSEFVNHYDPADGNPFWTSEFADDGWHMAVVIGSWASGFQDTDVHNFRCVRSMP